MLFFSFLIVGCDSIGGTTLTDTRGNKYTFKDVSVTCDKPFDISFFCEGSAIKKDISGKNMWLNFKNKFVYLLLVLKK